jgi:hypothetical protein
MFGFLKQKLLAEPCRPFTSRSFEPKAITSSFSCANNIRPKLFNATQMALETAMGIVKKQARFRAFSKQGWTKKQALSRGQSARLCCGMNHRCSAPQASAEKRLILTLCAFRVPDYVKIRRRNVH